MPSVLSKAASADVRTDPFPHLVIREALEPSYYARLMQSFPSLEEVNAGKRKLTNNDDTYLGAVDALVSPAISNEWKEFFRFHTSREFLAQALGLIGQRAVGLHPSLAPLVADPSQRTLALADSGERADFYIQCQFGMNSPVVRESSVRTAHVDNPKKIYNALLYCRHPNDDSVGGDLALYRFHKKPGFYGRRTALPGRIEAVAHVPYAANTLVLFANSPRSVHGVTPRKPTPHVRRYINFQVELEKPLFDIPYVNPLAALVERTLG